MIGSRAVAAWVLAVGLVLTTPVVIAGDPPAHLRDAAPALAFSSAGTVIGFLLVYTALMDGQVSLIAPIVSAEGAVAAIVAVALGEPLSALSGLALVVIAAGVALASTSGSRAATSTRPSRRS